MYQFNNFGHSIVLGQTQQGKTYATEKILMAQDGGVLFFNTQLEDMNGYIKVDRNTSFKQIKGLLKIGKKLNYMPYPLLHIQMQEISYLINQLFDNGGFTKDNAIYVAIDEVHLFTKQAQTSI